MQKSPYQILKRNLYHQISAENSLARFLLPKNREKTTNKNRRKVYTKTSLQIILYQTKSAAALCQKLAEEKSIPAKNSEEKSLSIKKLKENLDQKTQKNIYTKIPTGKISTKKYLKKNLYPKLSEEKPLPKKTMKRSLYNKNLEISAKNQKKSLPQKQLLQNCKTQI